MNALILDGATGKRMKPITDWIPKDLMGIDGVSLLERHIQALKNIEEIEKIVVTTHQHFEKVHSIIEELNLGWWDNRHRIRPHYEETLKGTAHSTLKVWEELGIKQPLIIIYGDVFFPREQELITNMIQWYRAQEDSSLLGCGELKDPPSGVITGNPNSLIEEFVEHPSFPQEGNLSHAGLAILHPNIFPLLKEIWEKYPQGKFHLGEHFFPLAVKEHPCYAYNIGEHYDIGTIEQYCNLQERIYNQKLGMNRKFGLTKVFKALLDVSGIIYLIGNGGSLAVAQHTALDLTKAGGKKALPLSNPEVITAYANDLTFERMNKNYLKNFITKQDVLIAFSTSGKSPNILEAVEHCNKTGVTTIGITSKNSMLAKISKITIEFDETDPKILEDLFSIVSHKIVRLLEDVKP